MEKSHNVLNYTRPDAKPIRLISAIWSFALTLAFIPIALMANAAFGWGLVADIFALSTQALSLGLAVHAIRVIRKHPQVYCGSRLAWFAAVLSVFWLLLVLLVDIADYSGL